MVHFCLYWNCLSFSVCFKQVWAGEKSIGSEVSAGLEGQTHRHAFGGVPLGKPLGLSGSQFLLLLLFSCQVVSHSCDPMDCGPPVSVYGISQARILKWAAISFSRGSSQPRDRTCVSCIGRQILSHWATWEAPFLPLHGGGEGDNNSDCTGLLWALAKWPIQCLAYRYSVLGGTICWPFSQRKPFILFRDNLNREWGCPTSNTGQ